MLPNLASCCLRDARTLQVSEGHRAPPCWGRGRARERGPQPGGPHAHGAPPRVWSLPARGGRWRTTPAGRPGCHSTNTCGDTRGQRPPHLRGVRLRGRGHPVRFGVGMPVWELSWGCQGVGSDVAGDKLLVLSLASWGHPQCDGKTLVGGGGRRRGCALGGTDGAQGGRELLLCTGPYRPWGVKGNGAGGGQGQDPTPLARL